MKSMLITGATGFLGQALMAEASAQGQAAIGTTREPSPSHDARYVALGPAGTFDAVIASQQPELVVHAAFENRKPDHTSDDEYLAGVVKTTNAVMRSSLESGANVVLISSSAVYASCPDEPIDESSRVKPVSLYGVAKATQELIAGQYESKGLRVVTARLFNLIGPGQRLGMLVPDWIAKAKQISNGQADEFLVPHMRTTRDFVDVRDAASAVLAMAQEPSGSIFNVCSGVPTPLSAVVGELQRLVGHKFAVVETSAPAVGTDVAKQVGCFDRLAASTGWHPKRSISESLDDAWAGRTVASAV